MYKRSLNFLRIVSIILFVGSFLVLTNVVYAVDGERDTTFSTGSGPDNSVSHIIVQPNGRILIGGAFTSYLAGYARKNIAQITTTGSLVAAFNPGTGPNDTLRAMALQSDGKILIGGSFTSYNGTTSNRLARLNTDGTRDSSFLMGTGANADVYAIAVQDDGKILIGGNFTSYNGTSINRIARLNTDGTIDSTFTPGTGANNYVYAIAVQDDGKILIGGSFTNYKSTTLYRLARLTTSGAVDTTYLTTGSNGAVRTIAIQPDGKSIIAGELVQYNQVTRGHIARVNTNGTLDTTFDSTTGANGIVQSVSVQFDGKIIIGGSFTLYNGTTSNYLARINTNGTIDSTFSSGTKANNTIAATALQADGKILIGGSFTTYDGVSFRYLTRLLSTSPVSIPTLTTQATTNITPTSATINAEITNTGGSNPERIIEYGTTTNTYTNSCTQGTGGIGTYSCTLSNLTPGTTYYYKAKATNSAGTAYGTELSFTTQSIPAEVTIPNPTDAALSQAVTSAYFSLNQGTVSNTQEIETNTTIKLTTTSATITLPPNTAITEENNNAFDFTQFQTTNTTQQVKQFAPSLAAVKVGVPNTKMAFSNPITLTLTVGQAYNNKTLNILYQEDGENTWNPQGTCTITDGKCTFQTDHATTYTVNGDGTISGAGQNDITTDVQDVLSMDCDQTGNTNDNIVEFGNLTPGTPVTGSTTCTVTTNSDAGYTLAVKREDITSTMDKDGDTATDITDRTIWNNTSPNATTWQTNDTGLAFTVYNTTATKNTTWWGTGTTVTDANNNYAGFPTSYTDIMQHTEYDETATVTQIGYKLDVPTTQKSGIYSGDITYQVVTAP